jgi:SAM-dependent methyltransferase
MDTELIQAEERLEAAYWWFVGRRVILDRLLGRFLPGASLAVDVGCGSGRNLEILSGHARGVLGVDRSLAAVRLTASRGFPVVQADGNSLPLPDASVDLLAALDVLEHMDDDIRTLAEFRRVLRPGGQLVLAVPAYRFLWSEHDEALRHRRRYLASELHIKLTNTGFEVYKRSYAVFFAFFPIMFYRLARGLVPKDPMAPKASYVLLPRPLNRMLAGLLSLEGRLMRGMNFPFGTSIIMMARRR